MINIRYHTQRDNTIDPFKTCFPTSVAMVIEALEHRKARPRQWLLDLNLEDAFNDDIRNNLKGYKEKMRLYVGKWTAGYHPRYVFGFWKWYIENKVQGFKCTVSTDLSREAITSYLDQDIPVITSTSLTGTGHIIVLNGYKKDQPGYYVNDPYGEYPYKTDKQKEDGHDIWYSGEWWLKTAILIIEPEELKA